MTERRAFAPGRVNLIGDHTDYTGGLAMPMAIQLGTSVSYSPDPAAQTLQISSSAYPGTVRLPMALPTHRSAAAGLEPEWAHHVAAVLALVQPPFGGHARITTTLPIGSGLSSSASLDAALALALGFEGSAAELARLCQQAEHMATGVPTGMLDQIAVSSAVAGHALLLDCRDLSVSQVPVPPGAKIVVAHCGVARSIARSAYSKRRAECEAAEREIGPLRDAGATSLRRLSEPVLRRRARHVVSENARVREFAEALARCDLESAGRLMNESHASLAVDFDVSTPELDRLATLLRSSEGVYGARLTGAGFGGCVVALSEAAAATGGLEGYESWIFENKGPASLVAA